MTAAAQDYSVALSGPSQVYAGSDAYVLLSPAMGENTSSLSLVSVATPSGSWGCQRGYGYTFECLKRTDGSFYLYNGGAMARALIHVGRIPLGLHKIVVDVSAGGVAKRLEHAIAGVSVHAAPANAKWESTMLSLAAKWCPTETTVMGFGTETQVWFYDGARVFYQVADYTADAAWNVCAERIARQYRKYVLDNKGVLPGWRVFPRGLRLAWERTGDASYRDALMLLATSSNWAQAGGSPSEWSIRETAYALDAYVEAERAGAARHPKMAVAVDFLLADFDRLFRQQKYSIHQLFFDGLAAEALIEYHSLTKDPRIVPTIRLMADWMIDCAWANNKLLINPAALNLVDGSLYYCSWGCGTSNTELIGLVVPAFAWLWRETGEARYRDMGDAMWAHMLDTPITYSGKIFAQNFKWTFDFLRWR